MVKKDVKKPSGLKTEEIVAKNIGAFRFLLGLDQERFAERTGLSVERVRDMEQGIDVLRNGIELLRIAEACNVSYDTLFEDEKSGATSARNAYFPEKVWKGIFKLAKTKFKSGAALAKMVSVHPTTPSLWYRGKAHPNPFAFQNLITLLKLKSVDLEALVIGCKLEEKHKEVVVEEPTTTPRIPGPEVGLNPDTFEGKVIKIMKLQNQLPELVKRLDTIQQTINTLRNELSELL